MAQADYVIANQTFPNTRTEINSTLQAIVSNNSGDSQPSTTYANMWWYETDTNKLQLRNEDNDAFIEILQLDQSNDKLIGLGDSIDIASTGGVTITTADNTDTLTLTSTDADANAGPILVLNRDSGSPADGDSVGALRFAADDDGGNSTNWFKIETFIRDASNGSEDVQMVMYGMSGGNTLNIMEFDTIDGGVDAGPEVVFNDGSSDIDFRVESNSHTHMLFVDGGNNRVGVKLEPDLGDGLHIKTGDSGVSSINASHDELIIEGSSNSGIAILSSTSNAGAICFGDSDNNCIAYINYDHATNDMSFGAENSEVLRFDGKIISTGGETSADVTGGSICIQQGSADGNAISFKSSDVAHGITTGAETDTYFKIGKNSATSGGVDLFAYSERTDGEFMRVGLHGNGISSTKSTSGVGAFHMFVGEKLGTNISSIQTNDNMITIAAFTATRFIFDAEGDFHADSSSTTFDAYDDAQLVRAYDLSHGKGVINSKFDKFIEYNHEKLADLKLVGREEDGTPNNMVSVTGMQRLHNGAIWQQYEKHQKLASAFYKLAEKTIGKEEADKLLTDEEIQLLN